MRRSRPATRFQTAASATTSRWPRTAPFTRPTPRARACCDSRKARARSKPGPPTRCCSPRPTTQPDGMRSVGAKTTLLVEGAGPLDQVTVTADKAEIKVLREGLIGPTAVTLTGGMVYVSEARLNFRNDPKLRDQDP